MTDAPEIPEPEKAPPEEKTIPTGQASGEPHLNGTSHVTDSEKLIAWMETTDKELKIMRLTQLVLCGAVLMLLVTAAKGNSLKIPSNL